MKKFFLGTIIGIVFFLCKLFLPRFGTSLISSGLIFNVIYIISGLAFALFIVFAVVPAARHLINNRPISENDEANQFAGFVCILGGRLLRLQFMRINFCNFTSNIGICS